MSCEREKASDAVDNTKVDRLCLAAHLRGDKQRRHIEHLCGGVGVDVLVGVEGGNHVLVLRDVRQYPQLDLGVVGVDQLAVRLCLKEGAQAAPSSVRTGSFAGLARWS